MSWTFNPPPGWPRQPPGWRPAPGWEPDPSWPAAPAGWQFWVPTPAPPAGPPTLTSAPTIHDAPTTAVATHDAPATVAVGLGPLPAGTAPPQPWHQRWWAVAAVALAVLLVGCLGGAALAVLTDP